MPRVTTWQVSPNDPIQFPKRYDDPRDIEISAYLISIISWGRRSMILRNGEHMHQLLCNSPYRFCYGRRHRVDTRRQYPPHLFGRHLRYALRGLRSIYRGYGSLEEFGRSIGIERSESPAWELAKAINNITSEADRASLDPFVRSYPLPARQSGYIGVETTQYGFALACEG